MAVRQLSIVGISVAFLAAIAPVILAADARPPNVVVICADDHAAYVTGAYGNTRVRTPNIDAIASAGVRFDRAFCNSPVCTASRQSFLSGRIRARSASRGSRRALPAGAPTMAEAIAAAGYDTAAVGKMHFNSDLRHGFRRAHRFAGIPPVARSSAARNIAAGVGGAAAVAAVQRSGARLAQQRLPADGACTTREWTAPIWPSKPPSM